MIFGQVTERRKTTKVSWAIANPVSFHSSRISSGSYSTCSLHSACSSACGFRVDRRQIRSVQSYFLWSCVRPLPPYLYCQSSNLLPAWAEDAIEYETKIIQPSGFAKLFNISGSVTEYEGYPTPEIDARWHELSKGQQAAIPEVIESDNHSRDILNHAGAESGLLRTCSPDSDSRRPIWPSPHTRCPDRSLSSTALSQLYPPSRV